MTAIKAPQFQIRIQWDVNLGEWAWSIFSEQKPGRYIDTLYKGSEYSYTGATTQAAHAVLELINIEQGVEKLVEQAREKAAKSGHTIPFDAIAENMIQTSDG